ncbi:hypothetical protein BpHYR1_052556 [Brachionus plicatilis]|uniref:Uncharacterized protein n=1 Tax=Brachionus plicatilis TaxID=10195 RepID=A0A3M7PRM3_BRAPC|nr:hypothetical protein BpHYR1_052556 [Brachionus plicatilis]
MRPKSDRKRKDGFHKMINDPEKNGEFRLIFRPDMPQIIIHLQEVRTSNQKKKAKAKVKKSYYHLNPPTNLEEEILISSNHLR